MAGVPRARKERKSRATIVTGEGRVLEKVMKLAL